MDPPKIRTPFKPITTWRPKKGLQCCWTWQDRYISLTGAGEELHNFGWCFWETGQCSTEAEREDLERFLFFLQSTSCFHTLEGNFYQVSLTSSRLNQIKSQSPLAPCGSGSGLRLVTPPASFHLLGSCMMAALYWSIQLLLQIQILLLWSTLLIQSTPGLQMAFCLDLPSSSLLWSRGPTERKTKD